MFGYVIRCPRSVSEFLCSEFLYCGEKSTGQFNYIKQTRDVQIYSPSANVDLSVKLDFVMTTTISDVNYSNNSIIIMAGIRGKNCQILTMCFFSDYSTNVYDICLFTCIINFYMPNFLFSD